MIRLLPVLLLFFTTLLHAEGDRRLWSGNSWIVMCEDYPGKTRAELDARCEAYLEGVINALTFADIAAKVPAMVKEGMSDQQIHAKITPHYCISDNQPLSQYVLVVNKYMKSVPEKLHGPAADLIDTAMTKAFLCPR